MLKNKTKKHASLCLPWSTIQAFQKRNFIDIAVEVEKFAKTKNIPFGKIAKNETVGLRSGLSANPS